MAVSDVLADHVATDFLNITLAPAAFNTADADHVAALLALAAPIGENDA